MRIIKWSISLQNKTNQQVLYTGKIWVVKSKNTA